MDVIELLETPWQTGVSILEISSVGQDFITTKQHIFRIGEMFQYKLYPYGKDAPYCEGSMLFRRHSSILEFKLSGEPRLKNL